MSNEQAPAFDEWAIVDVMGHQRYIGKVTEQVIAGKGFVRVDIPETEKTQAWTKLIGTDSIYAITPVSKDIAVAMAKKRQDVPINAYDLTPKLVQQTSLHYDEDDDDGPF